mmetsp:Transcript_46522/g.101003  ORF Transcript_46522/g.101003 Transcript_46522/m.101003 type:complete len:238 (+) Transcript_46522:409-1122(+)
MPRGGRHGEAPRLRASRPRWLRCFRQGDSGEEKGHREDLRPQSAQQKGRTGNKPDAGYGDGASCPRGGQPPVHRQALLRLSDHRQALLRSRLCQWWRHLLPHQAEQAAARERLHVLLCTVGHGSRILARDGHHLPRSQARKRPARQTRLSQADGLWTLQGRCAGPNVHHRRITVLYCSRDCFETGSLQGCGLVVAWDIVLRDGRRIASFLLGQLPYVLSTTFRRTTPVPPTHLRDLL